MTVLYVKYGKWENLAVLNSLTLEFGTKYLKHIKMYALDERFLSRIPFPDKLKHITKIVMDDIDSLREISAFDLEKYYEHHSNSS